jgi:hypothetical protein
MSQSEPTPLPGRAARPPDFRDLPWRHSSATGEAIFSQRHVNSQLHEQINPAIGDRREPEAFVEPQRGIEALDVDAQRLAGSSRL